MKKYAIFLAAALSVCAFSGCEDEAAFPYIPYEKPVDPTPPSGETVEPYTVNYRLDKVLQCYTGNTGGTNIISKFDFFSSLSMTLNVSTTEVTLVFDNGTIPFYPFEEQLPEGPIQCVMDTNASPNVLRTKDTGTVLATFEKDGFTVSFKLDSKALTYQYKFKSIN